MIQSSDSPMCYRRTLERLLFILRIKKLFLVKGVKRVFLRKMY